jgi:hypothetical protein
MHIFQRFCRLQDLLHSSLRSLCFIWTFYSGLGGRQTPPRNTWWSTLHRSISSIRIRSRLSLRFFRRPLLKHFLRRQQPLLLRAKPLPIERMTRLALNFGRQWKLLLLYTYLIIVALWIRSRLSLIIIQLLRHLLGEHHELWVLVQQLRDVLYCGHLTFIMILQNL